MILEPNLSNSDNPFILTKENINPLKVNIELESEINEFFSKSKITQKFINTSENPLELKIFVSKKEGLIFSSFSCKVGDSIFVKSKVIQKEKALEKYSDSTAKGNAAIFVSEDRYNDNIIINMGNIPAKEEVIFISEFIQLIESSKTYEFELFRNFPIFKGDNGIIYQNSDLKGKIHIKVNNKIIKIEKEILMKELKIDNEKYENTKNNSYLISYKIEKLPEYSSYNLDYIPSSKIYFELEEDKPIIYTQKSIYDKNEQNYIIQYKAKTQSLEDENFGEKPALFIFLIDQSGSMSGDSIKIASKALVLFLQSLPAKSYYQIIGFGSDFKKYDETPKEYNETNINKSIKMIEKLTADLGGTDIYSPLKDIYDSYTIYDKINLPKNIFLLTDGEIVDKNKTLNIIEKNSSKFAVFSIGIGSYFDQDLIKNAGILGKGSYNFCKDINKLNSIIANEISRAISPFISEIKINTSLDNSNLLDNNFIPKIMRDNEIINLNYIVNNKDKKDLIKLEIQYLESDKKNKRKYEIKPEEIPEGEELSKLIINNYLNNNSNISNEEKIKKSLKYQLLTEKTSLFAEIELSNKITEEMKTKIIGDKNNNIYKEDIVLPKFDYISKPYSGLSCYMLDCGFDDEYPCFKELNDCKASFALVKECSKMQFSCEKLNKCQLGIKKRKSGMKSKKTKKPKKKKNNDLEEEEEKELEEKEKCLNLNEKEDIMKIIKTQNFIKGYWDENNKTKIIKEKYKNEFNLLKGLKNKNINDNVIMTIIMIYFIYKEHSELLTELSRIIKKAKIFIKKETKSTYEDIIKKIQIN